MTNEQPAAPQQPLPTEIPSTQDERTMALLCHAGGALTGFIIPLVVWLIKKDQSKFIDDQGKEALNFQITLAIAHAASGALVCFHWGLLNLAIWVGGIVFGILGSLAVNKGEVYRYPLTLRLIK